MLWWFEKLDYARIVRMMLCMKREGVSAKMIHGAAGLGFKAACHWLASDLIGTRAQTAVMRGSLRVGDIVLQHCSPPPIMNHWIGRLI